MHTPRAELIPNHATHARAHAQSAETTNLHNVVPDPMPVRFFPAGRIRARSVCTGRRGGKEEHQQHAGEEGRPQRHDRQKRRPLVSGQSAGHVPLTPTVLVAC